MVTLICSAEDLTPAAEGPSAELELAFTLGGQVSEQCATT